MLAPVRLRRAIAWDWMISATEVTGVHVCVKGSAQWASACFKEANKQLHIYTADFKRGLLLLANKKTCR